LSLQPPKLNTFRMLFEGCVTNSLLEIMAHQYKSSACFLQSSIPRIQKFMFCVTSWMFNWPGVTGHRGSSQDDT
jgi:hypothetical protein